MSFPAVAQLISPAERFMRGHSGKQARKRVLPAPPEERISAEE